MAMAVLPSGRSCSWSVRALRRFAMATPWRSPTRRNTRRPDPGGSCAASARSGGGRRRSSSCRAEASARLMDLVRGAQARLDRPLDPRMLQRRMLAGEMNAPLGLDDVRVEQRLLPGVEQRERAARELVVVPHLGRADFELLDDLRMDRRHVVEGLADAIGGGERAPPPRGLRPPGGGPPHPPAPRPP